MTVDFDIPDLVRRLRRAKTNPVDVILCPAIPSGRTFGAMDKALGFAISRLESPSYNILSLWWGGEGGLTTRPQYRRSVCLAIKHGLGPRIVAGLEKIERKAE